METLAPARHEHDFPWAAACTACKSSAFLAAEADPKLQPTCKAQSYTVRTSRVSRQGPGLKPRKLAVASAAESAAPFWTCASCLSRCSVARVSSAAAAPLWSAWNMPSWLAGKLRAGSQHAHQWTCRPMTASSWPGAGSAHTCRSQVEEHSTASTPCLRERDKPPLIQG